MEFKNIKTQEKLTNRERYTIGFAGKYILIFNIRLDMKTFHMKADLAHLK